MSEVRPPERPEPDGTPQLRVQGLGLTIGGATILRDVDLSVQRGRFLGVIGPNGAGKTTLFNLVSGVLTPTSGRIELGGTDITRLSVERRARRGLGRTFQTSSLFPGLSLLENVRLARQAVLGGATNPLRFPRRSDQASRDAAALLDDVGLGHRADQPAAGLPHGEKRKLEIAVLLAGDPDVILLDEPMAGVASGDVPGLSALIRSVHRDQGRTVLMVEHHMDVVLGLAEQVAVLHHGTVLAVGEPDAVMADPTVQSAYLGEAV